MGFFYIAFCLIRRGRVVKKSNQVSLEKATGRNELIFWNVAVQAFNKSNDIILLFARKRQTVKAQSLIRYFYSEARSSTPVIKIHHLFQRIKNTVVHIR